MAQHEWRLVSYSAVKPPEPQILYSQTSNQAQMGNAGERDTFLLVLPNTIPENNA